MRRYKSVSQRYSDALSQVSWQDFERLLANWYAGQGYRVEHVGTAGSGRWFDGGIDLKLFRGDEYVVVQCKHWNARQVTHNAVHELLGVMLTERATGAIVVTSGEFTAAAHVAAAHEPRAQLIDGAGLRKMLGDEALRSLPPPVDDRGPARRASSEPVVATTRPWTSRRRSRHPLPGILLAITAALVTLYFIRHALNEFAVRSPMPRAVTTRSLPPPSVSMQAPAFRPYAARAVIPKTTTPRSQVVYRQTPMTDEELRAWKRRNAEAMKILEKTTPEMPLR
jgi:hypothetical protein